MLHHRSRVAMLVIIGLLSLARGLKVVRFPSKACSTGSSRSSTSSSKTALNVKTSAKAVSSAQGFASSEDNLDWFKSWYPVLSEEDSDPERAHVVQVCCGCNVYFS